MVEAYRSIKHNNYENAPYLCRTIFRFMAEYGAVIPRGGGERYGTRDDAKQTSYTCSEYRAEQGGGIELSYVEMFFTRLTKARS